MACREFLIFLIFNYLKTGKFSVIVGAENAPNIPLIFMYQTSEWDRFMSASYT